MTRRDEIADGRGSNSRALVEIVPSIEIAERLQKLVHVARQTVVSMIIDRATRLSDTELLIFLAVLGRVKLLTDETGNLLPAFGHGAFLELLIERKDAAGLRRVVAALDIPSLDEGFYARSLLGDALEVVAAMTRESINWPAAKVRFVLSELVNRETYGELGFISESFDEIVSTWIEEVSSGTCRFPRVHQHMDLIRVGKRLAQAARKDTEDR